MTEIIRQNHSMAPTIRVHKDLDVKNYAGALLICPSSALGTSWINKFKPFSVASASGWMQLRGAKRRRLLPL